MKLLRWNSVRPQGPQGKSAKPSASDSADRGWKSRKVSPLPVEGEIFSLTFPFIDQAIALTTRRGGSDLVVSWATAMYENGVKHSDTPDLIRQQGVQGQVWPITS